MTAKSIDSMTFLETMASGVVVLTVTESEGPLGVALASLVSYSIDPPSVVASVPSSIARSLSPSFGVSLLASSQREIGQSLWGVPGRLELYTLTNGVLHISDALAYLECSPVVTAAVGEATIVVAEVKTATIRDAHPLVWLDGEFVDW